MPHARARNIARDSGSYFLLGVVDWKQLPSGQWFTTNSAVLVDPSGRRVFTYDKIHLVPFGEYVPLRRWLTFTGKLTADISDFTPGSAYAVAPVSRRQVRRIHLLRGDFPQRSAPLHRATAPNC